MKAENVAMGVRGTVADGSASGTVVIGAGAQGAVPGRTQAGALDWARAMEASAHGRTVAPIGIPTVPVVDSHAVSYAGWAVAFAFLLLLVASRLKERGNAHQLSLHGDAPELFLIPKALLARRPRR